MHTLIITSKGQKELPRRTKKIAKEAQNMDKLKTKR